jgi:hypothetical protein
MVLERNNTLFLLFLVEKYGILATWETIEPGGLPSFGGATLQTKERRAVNVCYIH